MIKAILFLFNLLGIFLCGLFFPGTVTVTQIAPSSAEKNNSVLVQVTINKGDLNGQGKFIEQLPAGFTAVPIDDEGAQTNFDSNTISFAWNSLPTDGVLNISFRVDITSSAAVQNYVLTGRFLYAINNQNLEADCPPSNITITNGTQAGSPPPISIPQNNNMGSSSPQTTGAPPNNNIAPASSAPQVNNTSSGAVYVVRQFSSATITPKTDTKVTLTIHKGTITGFAKIEDSIPPGFTAGSAELNGASFTFVDNRAKFVWENMPSDSVITVSYRMSAISNVPGTHVVVGNFSYLNNNTPFSTSIGSSIFNSSVIAGYDYSKEKNAPPPVVNNTTDLPSNSTTSTANNTPPVVNTPPANNTNVANTPPTIANTNVTPPTTSGVTYRVQIMALRNPAGSSYFVNSKKIKEHVNTESVGGLTKYTVGNYTDYKSVKDARDDLRSKGFEGAFVVPYKSGVRITLQEALMISHQ